MQREPEASPLKNITGGSGCGCGCMGAVLAMVGVMLFAGISIQLFEQGSEVTAQYAAIAAILVGGAMSTLGVVLFGGSLFID